MESKDVIIDTSVWVSLFNDKDTNHTKAKKLMQKFSYYQIMPDLIFYETITVLKMKTDLKTALDFTDFATDNRDIVIRLFYEDNRLLIDLVRDERFKDLSYTDTLLLHLSRKNTIVTFDKELAKNIKRLKGNVEGV